MTILIIDDDQDDVDFLSEAAMAVYPLIEFIVAHDGEDAIELLDQMSSLPNFIFVDRNMPRMDGKSFLFHLKDDDNLNNIPIIMHSTNFSDSDLVLYYSLNVYTMKKQHNFAGLVQDVKVLFEKIEYDRKIKNDDQTGTPVEY